MRTSVIVAFPLPKRLGMKKMLLSIVLLVTLSCCSGLPTYNPRPRQETITSALDASIEELNSQSWGKNLLRLSRTGEIKVKPLLQVRDRKEDGDVFEVLLQFTVRETTCNKNTAIDPSECEFKAGLHMETPCESRVFMSQGKAIVLKAHCNLRMSSSSESHSSEEMFLRTINSARGNVRAKSERFPSQWDPYGMRNQNVNPRWEEEDERIQDYSLME
ncbi:secreted phosphoprotein 24 [Hyla sarda]|uniref:secreted phosphoprotein 24 n=1 Tax=Hyla sarda TaxID=327740 RepID=UPI0024C2F81B|nr:secreted phosphoprotein 24 [Hyla sarda]